MSSDNPRYERKYIPEEISSEIKISRKISMKVFMVLIGSLIISGNLTFLVHPKLQFIFMIFCFLVAGVLVIPSRKGNPGKMVLGVIFLSLFQNKTVYHAIGP